MNPHDPKQGRFALVREMMEAPEAIRRMDWRAAAGLVPVARERGALFMTGEGSSRILPAKNSISLARRLGIRERIGCEGARQAAEYALDDVVVFGASNSGKTREVIDLFRRLRASGHKALYGLTATPGSLLERECARAFVLSCGEEKAVAATKSVVEQALFYQVLVSGLDAPRQWPALLGDLAEKADIALRMEIEAPMARRIAAAETVYVAGRNDGVAEELALKTCEIARKKALYCEGTYVVHGVEEAMAREDAVILVDPYEAEWEKYKEVLVDGVGLCVMAIAARPTPFPTLLIPSAPELDTVIQLCAGWNLLVAVGLELGIDLDRPVRARKVGNEFVV